MTTESVSLRNCEALVKQRGSKRSTWRDNLNMVNFEAFLLSRGHLPSTTYTMCQRVSSVAKNAGGFKVLSGMDVTYTIPLLFPGKDRKYRVCLGTAVRTYQEFRRTWKEDPSFISLFLVEDVPRPIPSWRDEPVLIEFHQYLMRTERVDASQMIGLCQRIYYLYRKICVASLDELTYCDIDELVGLNFKDKAYSYCSYTRRAIRLYQKFSKLGVRL